jgi:hypothetical protein
MYLIILTNIEIMTLLDIEGMVITIGLGLTAAILVGYLMYRYVRQRIRNRKNW